MRKVTLPLISALLLFGISPVLAVPEEAVFSVASTSSTNTAHDKASVSVKGTKAVGLTSYTVTATSKTESVKVTVTPPSAATEWEVPVAGLNGGESYSFIVTTTDQTGSTDSDAQTFTPISVPDQPTNVSIVGKNASGVTSADITFTQADEGGSPITKYILTSSQGTSQDCTSPAIVAGSKVCSFTSGLTAGLNVGFKVVAVNAIGNSAEGLSTLDVKVPTTPGVPTLVDAQRQSDGSVKVTWITPLDDGGTPITGYTVLLTPASGTELSAPSVGVVNEYSFTSVANGTWTAKVTAKNSAGPGTQVLDATPLLVASTDQTMTLTPTPTISGTAQVGQSITAVPGTWDAGVALTYQWNQDDAPIIGAISSSYVLTTSNLGGVISVTVSATKTGFVDASRTSVNTAAVIGITPPTPPPPSGGFTGGGVSTPTVSPSPTPSPSASATPSPTASATPTPTPSATPSPTASATPTPTPSASPTASTGTTLKANSFVALATSKTPTTNVSLSTSAKTLSVKAGKAISVSLPTVAKGTTVVTSLKMPDGKTVQVSSIKTTKSGKFTVPSLLLKKPGTYTLQIKIGKVTKTVKVTVKK
jgi:hypothetical protein